MALYSTGQEALPLSAMGLSIDDLRQAFREFDLDKNGCAGRSRGAPFAHTHAHRQRTAQLRRRSGDCARAEEHGGERDGRRGRRDDFDGRHGRRVALRRACSACCRCHHLLAASLKYLPAPARRRPSQFRGVRQARAVAFRSAAAAAAARRHGRGARRRICAGRPRADGL